MQVIADLLIYVFKFVGNILDFCKTFLFEFPTFLLDVIGLGNLPQFVKSWVGMLATLILAIAIIRLVKDVRGATV